MSRACPQWLSVVAELGRSNVTLSLAAERLYEKHCQQSPTLSDTSIVLRPEQEAALRNALAFLKRAGYTIDQYPIIVTDRLGENVLGRAASGRIYISVDAFRHGDATLIGTLLEEWLHLNRNFRDCSRPMQNWLIDAVIEQAARADYLEQAAA